MVERLNKLDGLKKRRGPVVQIIMDGVGYGKFEEGDAVKSSLTPYLNWFHANCPNTKLKAHGKAVGLPSDGDMGNSEVGHNAIGSGRVFSQGAALVQNSIETGAMFKGETWQKAVGNAKDNKSAMHFIGLFSDGNVHSNVAHLRAMIEKAKDDGVAKVRVHILLDGRDVGETSALEYVEPFEAFLSEITDDSFNAKIASGGGRMKITMDRYNANWNMVDLGWKTHVLGEGATYASAKEAIEDIRKTTGAIDQDLDPFVIAEAGKPVGKIVDGDTVIFFNFRGDRSLEITAAFEQETMDKFDRGPKPDVFYAGMMEYDGDLNVPANYLVEPPAIDRVMGEFLCQEGIRTLAISETQKYGHVTYFYNGNRSGKLNEGLEEYIEVPSDILPFEQRPWMKAAEITDEVLKAIENGKFDFIRLNLANGDMVGHTGVYAAAQIAVETVDLQIGRIKKAIDKAGGVMVISADHGNADDMFEHDKKTGAVKEENGIKKVKTAHSLNPVPCIIYDPEFNGEYESELNEGLGISSLAATVINLLGFEAPSDYDKSILKLK